MVNHFGFQPTVWFPEVKHARTKQEKRIGIEGESLKLSAFLRKQECNLF